jgi:hypothetical protein
VHERVIHVLQNFVELAQYQTSTAGVALSTAGKQPQGIFSGVGYKPEVKVVLSQVQRINYRGEVQENEYRKIQVSFEMRDNEYKRVQSLL